MTLLFGCSDNISVVRKSYSNTDTLDTCNDDKGVRRLMSLKYVQLTSSWCGPLIKPKAESTCCFKCLYRAVRDVYYVKGR